MSNKMDLSWIKSIFESYKKEQTELIKEYHSEIGFRVYKGKMYAADDLLKKIKDFIKEANKLQEK